MIMPIVSLLKLKLIYTGISKIKEVIIGRFHLKSFFLDNSIIFKFNCLIYFSAELITCSNIITDSSDKPIEFKVEAGINGAPIVRIENTR